MFTSIWARKDFRTELGSLNEVVLLISRSWFGENGKKVRGEGCPLEPIFLFNNCRNEMARRHVCNIVKHWKKFVQGSLHNKTRNTHLRCKDCLHCPGCSKEKLAREFVGVTKTCTTCCTLWPCKPCGQSFPADEFEARNLDNHQTRDRTDPLVCKACRVDGYLPRDGLSVRVVWCERLRTV